MTKDMELTHRMVGHVGYRPARWASRAEVTLRGNDEQRKIARVKLPQWPGGEVRFYQPAAAQLRAAWAEVEAAGLLGLVKTWGDVFVPRLITTKDEQPTDQLSAHALGLAFDLNPEHHPLGRDSAVFGLPGGTRELVRLGRKPIPFGAGRAREGTCEGLRA